MTEALGAVKGERTPDRLGYRAATTVARWSPGSASGAAGATGPRRLLFDRAARALDPMFAGRQGGEHRV